MNKSTKKLKKLPSIKINTPHELSLRLGVDLKIIKCIASDIKKHRHKKTEVDDKGKERDFYPPSKQLRGVQKAIQKEILDRLMLPDSFHGGLKGRSIRTNALPHIRKKVVAEFDIKNFFPNISNKQVYKMFISQGCAPDVARLLTQLTTSDGHLVQGFLTSPKISVLVLLPIEKRIARLLKKHGITHTIWIDNLILSGSFAIPKLEGVLRKIFAEHGFELKEPKYTHLREKQEVTGTVVNDKVSPPKSKVRSLRKTKYLIGKYGVSSYIERFNPKKSVGQLKTELIGQLSYLVAVDRETYLPLHEWFMENIKVS